MRGDKVLKITLGTKILHDDFMEKSNAINQTVLRVGAVSGIIIELFNILRMLIYPTNSITAFGNEIYLGLCILYFICCLMFLVVDFYCNLSMEKRYRFYVVSAGIFLCWHLLFNMHELYRTGIVRHFTIVTTIFFFSGFLMFKPTYTIICMGLCSASFITFLKLTSCSGEIVSFFAMVCLCILMYLIRYKRLGIEIYQTKQIIDIQQELSDAQRDFRLTIEQYELIREQESSVTFEWNIRNDWIRFSKEWKTIFDQPEDIPNFHEYINGLKTVSEDSKKILFKCMKNIMKGMPYQKYELILPVKSGENRWFEARVIAQTDEQKQPVFGIGMLSDITDRKEKIHQLENEIKMDLFTGLFNKSAIERYGERKIKELRKGQELAALILDMDDFKDINDCYGHPVGDYVLKKVAEIMRQNAPVGARIGRIGGDEFIALYVSDDLTVFENYAKKLIKKVSEIYWEGKEVPVNCSIGLAAVSHLYERYDELYKKADEALYHAKNKRKNQLYSNINK